MWQKHIYRTRSIEGFRVRVNSQRFTKPQGVLFRCYVSLFWSQLVTCRGRNPAAQTPARRQVRRKGRMAGVGRPCRRRRGRGGAGAEVVRCGEDGGESTANPRPVSACGGGVGLFTLRPERTGLLCPETQRAFPPVTAPFHETARPVVTRRYCFLISQAVSFQFKRF